MIYVKEGRIIEINGHQWIEVDEKLTQPCADVYRLVDIIKAGGHIPHRFVATNLRED